MHLTRPYTLAHYTLRRRVARYNNIVSLSNPSRGRRTAIFTMALGMGVLALFAGTIEEGLQRCQIERLRSMDPEVRKAAASRLTGMLPRLKPSCVRPLVQVLEEVDGSRDDSFDRPTPAGKLRFFDVNGLAEIPPDFKAAIVFLDETKPAASDSRGMASWVPFTSKMLREHLREAAGVTEEISILGGKLALRAPLEVHLRVGRALRRLRARTDLFNAVFDPARIDARAGHALTLLLEERETSAWLRGCSLCALASIDPAAAECYK